MSENHELSVAEEFGLSVSKPQPVARLQQGGKIVPWLKVIDKNSTEAKDVTNIGKILHFKSSDNYERLGDSVLVFNAGYMFKAIRYEPELEISYDPDSDLFASIEKQANQAGSGNPGAQYGAEFFFVLEDGSVATMFLASKSARLKIPEFDAQAGKFCKILTEFIDPPKTKYSWWAPAITGSSESFDFFATQSEIQDTLAYLKGRTERVANSGEKVEEEEDASDGGR